MSRRAKDGRKVESNASGVLISGTDSEIRGWIANLLLAGGVDPKRFPRLIAAKRSQLYVDLSRPTAHIGRAVAQVYDPDAELDQVLDAQFGQSRDDELAA